jgi:hypothetical protein
MRVLLVLALLWAWRHHAALMKAALARFQPA